MGAGTSPADPASAGREADGPDSAAEGGSTATGNTEADGGAEAGRPVSGSEAGEPASGATSAEPGGEAAAPRRSRRFPLFTRDTAGPEGGGRAAPGDAPAPARQWPLLTVLCTAGAGLLIVALDPFAEAFRIGTILIGAALIAGAVLRWVVPSVGMLAVRSRFTDLVTYGLMGTLIVLLALVAQPKPWLDVPILEDAVRFTIR
ncbi:Membrane protein OS=Streptomyces microflavus OX=1919 GN=Smic_50660 PE=4 SV=1 [Streptomyces microflavus]